MKVEILHELPIHPNIVAAIPKFAGHKIAICKRDDETSPFVVCAIDENDKARLDWGFDAWTEITHPEHILGQTMNRFIQFLQTPFSRK